MESIIYGIRLAAAAPTSHSYVPQVKKALPSGATQDLSLKMLLALATGFALWVLYGSFKGDSVIILVNIVGFGMRSNSTTWACVTLAAASLGLDKTADQTRKGLMLGAGLVPCQKVADLDWSDLTARGLIGMVSHKHAIIFAAQKPTVAILALVDFSLADWHFDLD
jgi:MtN3 and saliva related transmembrane protein